MLQRNAKMLLCLLNTVKEFTKEDKSNIGCTKELHFEIVQIIDERLMLTHIHSGEAHDVAFHSASLPESPVVHIILLPR